MSELSARPWRIIKGRRDRVNIQSADYGTGLPKRDVVARDVRPEDAELIVRLVNAAAIRSDGYPSKEEER